MVGTSLEDRVLLALDLAERVCDSPAAVTRYDEQLARQRMSWWTGTAPFHEASVLLERLGSDSLPLPTFERILGEELGSLVRRLTSSPEWMPSCREIMAPYNDNRLRHLGEPCRHNFAAFVAPLVGWTRARVTQDLQASEYRPGINEIATIVRLATRDFGDRLGELSERALVLELNVARESGSLEGSSPQARFATFADQLGDPVEAARIFSEYPVLLRQLTAICVHTAEATTELLLRLGRDLPLIRAELNDSRCLGNLEQIYTGLGDPHCGQRSVALLHFGCGLKVVYKPRSLAVDQHFQDLLRHVNDQKLHRQFRLLRLIDRPSWGWIECAENRPCESLTDINDFYWRLGGLLAILFLTNAIDCHYTNVIADGSEPVMVDLEAMFQGSIRPKLDLNRRDEIETVFRVGLLPRHEMIRGRLIDLGGICGDAAAMGFRVPVWEQSGRDDMRVSLGDVALTPSKNHAMFDGTRVEPGRFTAAIEEGFVEVMQAVLKTKDRWTGPAGLLRTFGQDEVRVLLRRSGVYARIIDRQFHPEVLVNGLYRTRVIDQLWEDVRDAPWLRNVIADEVSDLARGDIPRFTSRPAVRALWSSDGREIKGFLAESGSDIAERRVLNLTDHEIQVQRSFLRLGLAALSANFPKVAPPAPLPEDGPEATRPELVSLAVRIADRLMDLALWSGEQVYWWGVSPMEQGHMVGPVGNDLYGGLAGIALFLGFVGDVATRDDYRFVARRAIDTALDVARSDDVEIKSVGVFSGVAGIIYCAVQLGVLWKDDALIDAAAALSNALEPLINVDEAYDIMAGCAGCALALIALHKVRPASKLCEMVRRCGARLITGCESQEVGVGWVKPPRAQALGGFSHGAAGIGFALLRLGSFLGDRAFLETGRAALQFQSSLFIPNDGIWEDRRLGLAFGENREVAQAWCHGAPGIALGFLEATTVWQEREWREAAVRALTAVVTKGQRGNHCLCHGDFGSVDVLIRGAVSLNSVYWLAAARRLAHRVLEETEEDRWLIGIGVGIDAPSLMNGITGIGYGALRLAEPSAVPSVLTLDPPPR